MEFIEYSKFIDSMGLPGIELEFVVVIPFTREVISLGVVLDRTLSWKPQIDRITGKVHRVLYMLRSLRSCTTEALRRRLVESLVLPHLDYCGILLLDATLEQKTRLQRLQNSCVRYLYGLRRDVHITPCRKSLSWLRTDTRRMYFTAILLYKIMNLKCPPYLFEMFTMRQSSRPARKVTGNHIIPRVQTEIGRGSFQTQGVYLWNSLLPEIKYLPTLAQFKRATKNYFFNLD